LQHLKPVQLVPAECEYHNFCFDSSLWFSGGSSTTNLFQALEEYLPALIGLAEEGSELRSKVQFVWANNLYGSPSICIYESGCAQLGYLDSVDSYMNLQVANTEKYIDGQLSGNLGEILIG